MTKSEAKQLAEPVVKAIVNCMADGTYQNILDYAELTKNDSVELFQEFAEGYLRINHLKYFDSYDVPCSFHVHYRDGSEYQQFQVYLWKDGSGFSVDYDLTTDGRPNDLTLQMNFWFEKSGMLRAVITDIHVL